MNEVTTRKPPSKTPVCSSGRCNSGCVACDAPICSLSRTEVLWTPYYRELGIYYPSGNIVTREESDNTDGVEPYVVGCQSLPDANYGPYDLFVLRTKLLPQLQQLNKGYDIGFARFEVNNTMRMTINVLDGGEFVSLDKEQAAQIQRWIDEAIAFEREYSLLITSRALIQYKGKQIPSYWVASMLPYVVINDIYQPFYHKGAIYIMLNPDEDFNSQWSLLHEQVIKTLIELHQDGAIVCHPERDELVIDDWALLPFNPSPAPEQDDLSQEALLYYPDWSDPRFAPDQQLFIRERLAGEKRIRLAVKSNVARHILTQELVQLQEELPVCTPTVCPPKLEYTFSRCCLEIECQNLDQAQKLADLVDRVNETAYGRIVSLVATSDPSQVVSVNAVALAAEPTVQTTVYATEGGLGPYLISVWVPIHIQGLAILEAFDSNGETTDDTTVVPNQRPPLQ
jgi:hypothetical protein